MAFIAMIQGLTPLQINFLEKSIKGFSVDNWNLSGAGFAGSDRRFLRVSGKKGTETYILVLWNSQDEDWLRFLTIEKEISGISCFLPHIYSSDEKTGLILEEDLGDMTLKKTISERPSDLMKNYEKAIDALVCWQNMPQNASSVISSRSMDRDVFLWESNYFALHCAGEYLCCSDMLDSEWEEDRIKLAFAASDLPKVCIHRDFQSENIIIRNDEVRFVDYQGARLGPAGYDLASLVFDPYIDLLDDETVESLLHYYRSKTFCSMPDKAFFICCLQRLLQALGAYANLSLHKGKAGYAKFIPVALKRCIFVTEKLPEFHGIRSVLKKCYDKLVCCA
jgi:N-acetylmuramate 1-kinase